MPYDPIRDETDGDPQTVYEDTEAHERLGFREIEEIPQDNATPEERIREDGHDI
jgi:hypothetical protein